MRVEPEKSSENADNSGIGVNFLSGVYRLGILLGAIITCGLCFYKIQVALSFALSGALSLSFLWILEYVVRRVFLPGGVKYIIKWKFWFFLFNKYLVVAFLLYLLLKTKWLNVPALAAGFGLAYAAITLEAFRIFFKSLKQ